MLIIVSKPLILTVPMHILTFILIKIMIIDITVMMIIAQLPSSGNSSSITMLSLLSLFYRYDYYNFIVNIMNFREVEIRICFP